MIAYVHCLFTITKDQTTISISNKVSTVTESNIGTVNAGFTVSLSNASYLPVTVTYTTADDTATVLDNDYVAGTGLVKIGREEWRGTMWVVGEGSSEGR